MAESPGLAILVTTDYKTNPNQTTLMGTNVDADEMRATFEQFNYIIHQLKNEGATKHAITSLLEEVSRNMSTYNGGVDNKVIIFAFSGHGSEFDKIITDDNEFLSLKDDIVQPLLRHPAVYKIPKLFLIDACRGNLSLQTKSTDGEKLKSVKEYLEKSFVHVEGNYRIEYATIADHVSYLDNDGSYWMPELARALREDDDSFQHIAAKVRKTVHELPGKKQQCESVSRLNTGPLYLKRQHCGL